MPKVFLSYRRSDSADITGRLADALRKKLGEENVFWDARSLEAGDTWPDKLRNEVEACDVLLAVMGKGWLSAVDEYHQRRIDLDDDWVRQEIASALGKGKPVIPVLVGGAAALSAKANLKADLAKLPDIQGFVLRTDGAFDRDLDALLDRIGKSTTAATPVEEYLRAVRQETGFLDMRGLKIDLARNIPLEALYIPLHTLGSHQDDETPLEASLRHQRVLIQGEAGSGKSTFLKRVACELAGGEPFPTPLPADGFPIFLKITHLEKHIAGCDKKGTPDAPTHDDHPNWLAHCLAARHNLPFAFVRQKLNSADTVVMLDGLDESPTPQRRLETMRLIERIADAHPKCRFVVTTRPRAGVQLHGFHQARIEPLSDEARESFLRDWTGHLYAGQNEEAAAQTRNEMLGAITSREEINNMARNPLMLTALAVLFWTKKRLPDERAKLYQAILDWLAEQRPERDIKGDDCLDHLGELAWGMQVEASGRLTSIEEGDAANVLSLDRKRALAFLHREEVDSGIVVRDGGALKFWHLTFQEFLAARHLDRESRTLDPDTEFRRDGRLYRAEWREVIRLYAGLVSKKSATALLNALLDEARGKGLVERACAVALVRGVLADLRPSGFDYADARYLELAATMVDLFRKGPGDPPALDPSVRVAAAYALEDLPVHPLLKLPWEEEYWVPIRGGTFVMGEEPKGRRFTLPDFRVGRHPVTVFEYAEYVRAGGAAPEYWDAQLQHPSGPVVYVTWDEAMSYCRWVADRAPGVRLPHEEEWEFAALGNERRMYPWGDQPPDENLANFDMKVGDISPVGLYPYGNTPEGIADMAGNVWEWTASDYDKKNKTARGGSYDDVASGLRAAGRSGGRPGLRYGYLGFRLIRE